MAKNGKTLAEAARTGDRRETLEALRDKLSTAIEETGSGRDIAALSKRLMEVMAELDAIEADEDDDPFAEAISRRRA